VGIYSGSGLSGRVIAVGVCRARKSSAGVVGLRPGGWKLEFLWLLGCFCRIRCGIVSHCHNASREEKGRGRERSYASPRPANHPPNPIDMLPAINSAIPPYKTTFVSLNADSPAVSAKGTVNPSDKPIVRSDKTLGSMTPAVGFFFGTDSSCVSVVRRGTRS